MQFKEFDIMLDIKKYISPPYIEIVQGDFATNIFNISMYDGLKSYSLQGTKVEVVFAKPDGNVVVQDESTGVVVLDRVKGEFQCTLALNTVVIPGRVKAEVRVLDLNNNLLTSSYFMFFVRQSIIQNDIVCSTSEFPILRSLIEETDNQLDRVSQIEAQVPEQLVADFNEHKAEMASELVLGHVKLPEEPIEVTTLLNGWVQTSIPLVYYKDAFGYVHLEGQISDGVATDGTIMFTLPVNYKPRREVRGIITRNDDSNQANIVILKNGDVLVYGLSSTGRISFNNVFK